jgi:hypothetical protein
MQDIDFDELDRAVSSALGTAGGQIDASTVSLAQVSRPTRTTKKVPYSTINSPIKVKLTSQAETPRPVETFKEAAAEVPQPTPIVSAPVQASTPTYSMRSYGTAPRTTPINPASSVHAVPTVAPRVVTTPTKPEPVAAVEPTPVRRSTGRFMDVVHPSSAMRSAQTPTPVALVAEEAPSTIETPEAAPTTHVDTVFPMEELEIAFEEETQVPLETPFLADAKVEKRPLGAFSDTSTEDESSQTEPIVEEVPAPTPAPALPPKPPVFEPSLEISEEALIGSSETSDTDPTKLTQLETPAVLVTVSDPTPVAPQYVQPSKPGVTSITQQYTEQKAKDEEPSGAIFDTESYHQPLSFPHKKKAGVKIVLWVCILLILGVGLGAAGYFFLLEPSLT